MSSGNSQKLNNKKYFLLRSKQTNTIFSSGCTLVEEEDFNELTAVPTTTILIATNADCSNNNNSTNNNTNVGTKIQHHDIIESTNNKIRSRHLPPLKLTSITTPTTKPITPLTESQSHVKTQARVTKLTPAIKPKLQPKPINISPETVSQLPIGQSKLEGDCAIKPTPLDETTTLTLASSSQEVESVPGSTSAASIETTTSSNSTTTNITNIPSYSRNTTTTRSWPVIYRNPQYYDYEALYAQAANQFKQHKNERNEQLLLAQPKVVQATTPIQQQQLQENQFAQSILYSSSNEDLTAFNDCITDHENLYIDTGGTVGGGGGINSSTYDYGDKQTTCYYFNSSRHNSIYEHPSSIICNNINLLTDSTAAAATTTTTTTSYNGEQEPLRRGSHNLYLRPCSYKNQQHHHNNNNNNNLNQNGKSVLINSNYKINKINESEISDIDDNSPMSLNSAMDGGSSSNNNNNTCCSSCCLGPPPVLYLIVTLLMTTSATAMLCAAIMTDHWEHVIWDRNSLNRYTNRSKLDLEWLMDDKVAMLRTDKRDHRVRRDSVFLVPMHGGIWTLCIDLPLHELQELRRHVKFPRSAPPCVNYLANSMENARGEEQRNDWQHSESLSSLQPHLRMQNLSISCSLVCLIILGSAALVGAFGVCQRQISAILITGVMYLLAATFALFTLMIIHFKRQQGRPMLDSDYDGTVDGIVARPGGAIIAKPLLGARIFLTSWSLDLGWGGVILCAIASMLWIFLSKIMRYNPLTFLLI